jgi:DNA-binding PadR family transcriptional regulator
MYGYEIAQALQARSEGIFALGQGTLYPLLYSLESKKLIRISREEEAPGAGRRRCYYMLTPTGRAELEADLVTWAEMVRGMKLVLGGAYA